MLETIVKEFVEFMTIMFAISTTDEEHKRIKLELVREKQARIAGSA